MRISLLFLSLFVVSGLMAQDKHKGQFEPYQNSYWQEIKSGLNEYETPDPGPKQVYRMDLSGVDIPQSVDEFTNVWCQPPESQGRTGTCWCFSTTSFFESEVFRVSKKQVELSELYIVYWEYVEKSREYIRTRGGSFFGEGSETEAVARMMDLYGMVPKSAYEGMREGQPFHDHAAMFDEMHGFLQTCKANNAWDETAALDNIKAILNHYLGTPPESFAVDGKNFTPKQYLKDELKLEPKEYVNFMSLLEAPFFTKAEYNVPDNWWNSDNYHNVPLDDFVAAIKTALDKGYSLSIGGDVSETGYNPTKDVAMVPSYDIPSEYIDDYSRQLRFTNGSTTDDHAIHLVGYLDKGDDFWFLIKDSGSGARNGKHEGYYFYHEDYVKLKTMSFTVHRDAVKDVLKKFKNL